MEKINVLFIGGFGRSGSTLLDNVFGQIDGVFSIGELRFIWDRSLHEKQLCGCKETLYECEIWSEILKEAFGKIDDNFIQYMLDLSQKVDKPKYIPKLLLKYDIEYNKNLKKYQKEIQKIYVAIHKVTNAKLIVDSSKTPSHGLIVNGIENINLKVLHLIRDLRAVTYSWKKKKLRPEITEKKMNMPTYSSFRSTIWWVGSNLATESLTNRVQEKFFCHYEDFCKNPKSFIRKIIDTYPEINTNLGFIDKNTLSLHTTHTVAGNPSRFKTGKVTVRLDDEWKHKMTIIDKTIVTILGWPFLLKYTYKIK